MKRLWFLLLLTALSAVLLTGCASNADTLATPTPGATNMLDNLMPGTTMNPTDNPAGTAAPGASASPMNEPTAEDARKAAHAMEEAVEKLSEVDDAYVIPLGDTALVGLEFENQYQGGLDDRLKKMVLARVQAVDSAVTKVAVTDNGVTVTAIKALAETLKTASGLNDVNGKAEEILKQLTVYGE